MKTANSRRKISEEATNLAIKLPGNQCGEKKRKRESMQSQSKTVRGKSVCFCSSWLKQRCDFPSNTFFASFLEREISRLFCKSWNINAVFFTDKDPSQVEFSRYTSAFKLSALALNCAKLFFTDCLKTVRWTFSFILLKRYNRIRPCVFKCNAISFNEC